MYQYSLTQWLCFFYFYCFFGWCFESTYVSIRKRKLVNRGFLRGPFLPLYGSGAIMMLLVSRPMHGNLVLIFLAGCVGATALEYVTGVTMEALFKVRYWDYSNNKFNFQGHICLGTTLCWGGLTILMTQVIHKPVENLVLAVPRPVLGAVVLVLTVLIAGDFAVSFQAALDLKDVLVKAEQARQELERMQKRLDVIIAVASDEIETLAEKRVQRREELIDGIEARFAGLHQQYMESRRERREAFREGVQEELQELRERYIGNRRASEEKRLTFLRSINRRSMLTGNPTMTSQRFRETLEELKEAASSYRTKKQDGEQDGRE